MLDNPKQFLDSLPNKPGVYEMYDAKQQILYVGKAKNLKKRLLSYFRSTVDPKTQALMVQAKNIEIIVTLSEHAALLLESNLIKSEKPHYNILFKDDKSFPYILLSRHDYPRLSVHRGAINKAAGKYFGPFPDATAVNFVVDLLQKLFHLRVCKDSFMRNRSRACMLHQIKLCGAPCVGCVDKAAYGLQVELVEQFLQSKSDYIVSQLTKLMDAASAQLAYEQAADYRDQIASIRKVQASQIMIKAGGDCDVIALAAKDNNICINVLFVRNGLVIGNKTYFPEGRSFILSEAEALKAFVMHYYLQDISNIVIPGKILLNVKLPDRLQIAAIFSEKFGRKITISDRVKGERKQLIAMADANAINSLKARQKLSNNYIQCLLDFKNIFHLSLVPKRVECFDVSHMMGEAAIASCVVFKETGPSKKDYRRFNIKQADAGDDYGALREVLLRRFKGALELPEVIMIDGGRGQLSVASQVLGRLKINKVLLLAIAKGKERKVGLEEIHIEGRGNPLILPPDSPALYFMQQIRDEAHRFAISGHRKKMVRLRHRSELENIPGVGRIRRALLLKHFGGIAELRSVGINELAQVSGVGHDLAKRIYEYLHA